jgi:hypothetical protein
MQRMRFLPVIKTCLLSLSIWLCLSGSSLGQPPGQPVDDEKWLTEWLSRAMLEEAKKEVLEALGKLPTELWHVVDLMGTLGGAMELHIDSIADPSSTKTRKNESLVKDISKELKVFRDSLVIGKPGQPQLCLLTTKVKAEVPEGTRLPKVLVHGMSLTKPRPEEADSEQPRAQPADKGRNVGVIVYDRWEFDKGYKGFTAEAAFSFAVFSKDEWRIETLKLVFSSASATSAWKLVKAE